ncbi:hypothetical protein DC522_29795 [Microvirga sp. KLBC 81]|uniref:integrase core domain-containing protein n=1 Tax=Microvirga sp. KLBC 81 TaxID=1862707 RepID=UPI000D520AEF|nr:hypothetical protein DC522_29795 [Microvirga sp. KLBC 81]
MHRPTDLKASLKVRTSRANSALTRGRTPSAYPPTTPRPKIPRSSADAYERFIQTLLREWAYAIPFSSSQARAADLSRWLAWYNRQRPHGSLGRRTPAQALAGAT